ncbi:unnamed protein product [Cyprideis torosa]|uniref:ATP synthase subunit gamma, mitochondrial n=1 Tax=Cyprideis torosa TaxID=163714 RepID=A0A7R8ZQU0_9CRUS|nr:unnamed protein product [Cyprideis torosa]CAG0897198.1 unnamed protein product [Cyprideis torosa]
MVSAAKYARAERELKNARPYGEGAAAFYDRVSVKVPPPEERKKRVIVAMTSDKGLCGAVHSSVCKAIRAEIATIQQDYRIVCVGDKSRAQLVRQYPRNIMMVVTDIGRKSPTFADAGLISDAIMSSGYDFDSGVVFYNYFRSVVSYRTSTIPLYNEATIANAEKYPLYDSLDSDVTQSYLEFSLAALMYHAMKESSTSEHSARMTAMDGASKNAGDMISKLTLSYNRTRQAVITKELIEIISGAAALTPDNMLLLPSVVGPFAAQVRTMATLKDISIRLKSVKNIQKITKSMKMVSAAKYARAERELKGARPYGEGAAAFYDRVAIQPPPPEARKKRLIVAMTSDKGLCGAIHSSICKAIRAEVAANPQQDYRIVCIGDKSRAQLKRLFGNNIMMVATEVGRKPPTFADAGIIAEAIMSSGYDFDSGVIFYNWYRSVVSYRTSTIPLYDESSITGAEKFPLYDSLDSDVTQSYLEFSLAALLYHAMKEANTSEQSARMTAMDNASKNAGEMIDKLTLTFNRTRQARLQTQELLKIFNKFATICHEYCTHVYAERTLTAAERDCVNKCATKLSHANSVIYSAFLREHPIRTQRRIEAEEAKLRAQFEAASAALSSETTSSSSSADLKASSENSKTTSTQSTST